MFRSTLVPGTVEDVLRPIIEEASGKRDGDGFFLCFQPEFLREGIVDPRLRQAAVHRRRRQPRAARSSGCARCSGICRASSSETSVRSAEMMKYCCNNFHALKITFANETARLCDALGVDAFEVMDLVCQDTQLNISTAYLKPGFAFGGSCLPKDLRAHDLPGQDPRCRDADARRHRCSPTASTSTHALDKVLATGKRRIGFIGLSFQDRHRRPARKPARARSPSS